MAGEREWWIDINEVLDLDEKCESGMAFSPGWLDEMEMTGHGMIHAIEYSAYEKRDHEAKTFCRLYNEALDKIVKLEKECGRDPADY